MFISTLTKSDVQVELIPSAPQYPQIGTFVGLQGVLVYALASSLPILTFPPLAARIRKLCPHGFVLTEFVRERFGWPAAVFLSAFSCLTMVRAS